MASQPPKHSKTLWLLLRWTKHLYCARILLRRQPVSATAEGEALWWAQSQIRDCLNCGSTDLLARKIDHPPWHQAREYTDLRQRAHACQTVRFRLVYPYYRRTQNYVLRDSGLCSSWACLLRAIHWKSRSVGCRHTDFWTATWSCSFHGSEWKCYLQQYHQFGLAATQPGRPSAVWQLVCRS